MMQRTLLLAVAAAFLSGGCASPPRNSNASAPPATQTPLPDARDLGEHPLDVLDIPQP